MPISRLDIVSMVPRSQEASSQRQGEVAKSFAEQAQIHSGFQKALEHNSQQTTKLTKSDNQEFRYDAKEKGKGSYQGQNKKKNNKDTKEEKEIKLSNFDIKI